MLNYAVSTPLTKQLCQTETLDAAWRKVRANKGGPGCDGMTIQQFEANLTEHLRQLSRELAEERYYPLPVQKFTMQKTNGSTREISVLSLKDRIVQRAVCDLITPIYEAKFLGCSFGYRPGRGVPHAVAEVNAIRAEGYEWVVDADIENFFGTMDNRILMRFLRATIKEPPILRLLQMWLDMGGIMKPPRCARWIEHIENAGHSVGEGVEQVINQLLQRSPHLDAYPQIGNAPMTEDWLDHDTEFGIQQSQPHERTANKFLINLGRDGLLLLLANSKRIGAMLATKHLVVIAPLVLAALATPAVAGIVKERLNQPRKIGIIQGSPLSPLLANLYLHAFDKAMTRAGIRMVRYADDLLLLCRSEGRAQQAHNYAQKRLAVLKLQLNPKKTKIAHFDDGIDFLGHVFDRDGCYQPLPDARVKTLQNQVQRTFKQGVGHVKRSGQRVTEQGRNIASQLGKRLKKRSEHEMIKSS
ncbi:MAG: reverse transcriptase domain-containing protein [Candidatus Poribacteria bacterium]|nr:reverse transcriptase domain-containing protein [Candidatus Poribacteria bacterium]